MSAAFKVDFMIVGAQKCGTTTLSRILRTHPSVVCSDPKEPGFFSATANWQAELPRYEGMFRRRDGAVYFEASTAYTIYPHVRLELWEDLYAYNHDLRIVYLVRDPIERVTSGYMHAYKRGYTDLGFEKAVLELPILLDITRYATQITPFIKRFGKNQVRILFFEDLVHEPNRLARDLASFLAIEPEGFRSVEKVHANKSIGVTRRHHKYDHPGVLLNGLRRFAPPLWRAITDNSARTFVDKPILSPAHQHAVLRMLRSEIDELENLTGRDLSHWRDPRL